MALRDFEKEYISTEHSRTGFIANTQRWINRNMKKSPPKRNKVLCWHTRFLRNGNLDHIVGNQRPQISDADINDVQYLFENSTRIGIRQAEFPLNLSRSTIQPVSNDFLLVYPYKMQNLHGVMNSDEIARVNSVFHYQNQPRGISEYLSRIVFSNECIFRLYDSFNAQNLRTE